MADHRPATVTPLCQRAEDLMQVILALPPGSWLVYYEGALAEDCEAGTRSRVLAAQAARDGAQQAHALGLCILAQRRREKGGRAFEYIAIRRAR